MIAKYHKFGLLIDLFEMMSKPSTDLPLENLIKWVFVIVFETPFVLQKILSTEFWIVIIILFLIKRFLQI